MSHVSVGIIGEESEDKGVLLCYCFVS